MIPIDRKHCLSIREVLNTLDRCIDYVHQNISCYCKDPTSNFTRMRKLDDIKLMKFMIQMQNKSITSELCEFFHDESLPSPSAFVQQRSKLELEALNLILKIFNQTCDSNWTIKGYHLLAADGSCVNIARNPSDKYTYIENGESKGYNQVHLNAMIDCLNGMFVAAQIDTASKTHETGSLIDMVDNDSFRFNPLYKYILTVDRGYESYRLIEHLKQKDIKYLIRAKDINSNGILSSIELPDGEFDKAVSITLTRKQTNEIKNDPSCKFVPHNQEFEFLDFDNEFWKMTFRVVRFKIDGNEEYECLITNLSEEEFSSEELKELYNLRWTIETHFRHLKYDCSMTSFHSKKREYNYQEIISSLIIHNVIQACCNNALVPEGNTIDIDRIVTVMNQDINEIAEKPARKRKYEYKPSFKAAATNVKEYLRGIITAEECGRRIKKFLASVRPGRSFERNVHPQSFISFNNRAA